jgi:hypothetical protein
MLFIEPEKTSLVVFYLAPSRIDLILFRLDMCSSHLCNTAYFLLTRGITVLNYWLQFICDQPLSAGGSSVITNPKSTVFTPLAVLKERSLLVDPEHQVHSYRHDYSCAPQTRHMHRNAAHVLHGV